MVTAMALSIAVIAAIVVIRGKGGRGERPLALVEGARGTAAAPPGPKLFAPEYEDGGEVLLRWSEVEGADEYQLQIFSPDHTELAKFPPGPSVARLIQPEELPAGYPRGTTLFWVVTAFYGGTPIAHSLTGPLQLR